MNLMVSETTPRSLRAARSREGIGRIRAADIARTAKQLGLRRQHPGRTPPVSTDQTSETRVTAHEARATSAIRGEQTALGG